MKKAISLSSLLLLSAMASSTVFGFGAKHSQVETKTSVVGKDLQIDIVVKPDAGMKLTKEGPWQVTFTQAPGLNLEMKDGKYVTKAFDEKIPGFKILAPLDAKAQSGTITYDVRAFVCTEDKKQCFPQQHTGTIDWKKS